MLVFLLLKALEWKIVLAEAQKSYTQKEPRLQGGAPQEG